MVGSCLFHINSDHVKKVSFFWSHDQQEHAVNTKLTKSPHQVLMAHSSLVATFYAHDIWTCVFDHMMNI